MQGYKPKKCVIYFPKLSKKEIAAGYLNKEKRDKRNSDVVVTTAEIIIKARRVDIIVFVSSIKEQKQSWFAFAFLVRLALFVVWRYKGSGYNILCLKLPKQAFHTSAGEQSTIYNHYQYFLRG